MVSWWDAPSSCDPMSNPPDRLEEWFSMKWDVPPGWTNIGWVTSKNKQAQTIASFSSLPPIAVRALMGDVDCSCDQVSLKLWAMSGGDA